MTESQAATTRFCARVIGPLMLIIGAIAALLGVWLTYAGWFAKSAP